MRARKYMMQARTESPTRLRRGTWRHRCCNVAASGRATPARNTPAPAQPAAHIHLHLCRARHRSHLSAVLLLFRTWSTCATRERKERNTITPGLHWILVVTTQKPSCCARNAQSTCCRILIFSPGRQWGGPGKLTHTQKESKDFADSCKLIMHQV